jgi:sRNA-binding carbon storage regulator CsrA
MVVMRTVNESITLGSAVVVTVAEVNRSRVRLRIEPPPGTVIRQSESSTSVRVWEGPTVADSPGRKCP